MHSCATGLFRWSASPQAEILDIQDAMLKMLGGRDIMGKASVRRPHIIIPQCPQIINLETRKGLAIMCTASWHHQQNAVSQCQLLHAAALDPADHKIGDA